MPLPSRSRAHAGLAIFTICRDHGKPLSCTPLRSWPPPSSICSFPGFSFSGFDVSPAEFQTKKPNATADSTPFHIPRHFHSLAVSIQVDSLVWVSGVWLWSRVKSCLTNKFLCHLRTAFIPRRIIETHIALIQFIQLIHYRPFVPT